MSIFPSIRHAIRRRAVLRERFDVARQMKELEETCVPSYLHPNPAAAAAAWARLFAAARVYRRMAAPGPVLDFGAGAGELSLLLPEGTDYDFVEADDAMAAAIMETRPSAVRRRLENLNSRRYSAIFALDSLEHNDDVGTILAQLVPALCTRGVFILSGPTENWFYKLGRQIAGFSGNYHATDIHAIEQQMAEIYVLMSRQLVPVGLPLFALSCWAVDGIYAQ